MDVRMIAAACAAAFALGAGAGWFVGEYRLTREHARQLAAENERTADALLQLAAARVRGDALVDELETARREAAAKTEELNNAIRQTTRGTACLRGDSLRLLDGAPGLRVSQASGGAIAAGAGDVATDADVARWAIDAGGQYADCARRLNALVRWHRETAPTLTPARQAGLSFAAPQGGGASLEAARRDADALQKGDAQ